MVGNVWTVVTVVVSVAGPRVDTMVEVVAVVGTILEVIKRD